MDLNPAQQGMTARPPKMESCVYILACLVEQPGTFYFVPLATPFWGSAIKIIWIRFDPKGKVLYEGYFAAQSARP